MKPASIDPQDTNAVLQEALHRLLKDEALKPFCDWFASAMFRAVQAQSPVGTTDVEEAVRFQRHVARHLWGHMPVPSNRWRARGLPKVERNDPCHCGSGRKFKQCCSQFTQTPLPMPADALLVLALDAADPAMLTHEKTRLIPALELGTAAMHWNEDGRPDTTLGVLGPLFSEPKALNERHEVALDALIDAMQQLGQERARRELLERMAEHDNKVLATTARCRLVSVLADQGEVDRAWKLFHETSRFNPNDPQLWPLEMTLLLSQGRHDEAQVRAPLLAARARQAGLHDLAGAMMQLAEQGLDAAQQFLSAPVDREDEMWMDVCSKAPASLDVPALRSLYTVDCFEADDDGKTFHSVSFKSNKQLADVEHLWRRRFPVSKPDLTMLDGDVDALLDELPEVLAFLNKYPLAWMSTEVLDDLLLTGLFLCDWHAPRPLLKATRHLAGHALVVLQALVGEGEQLHWVESANRPLLRCLAVAIELTRSSHDDEALETLLRWGLSLNPHDNHGWRAQLLPLWLEQARYDKALALMAQYAGDLPPSEHLRALALYCTGKQAEAEAVLREAHQRYPLFLNTLLPDTMDPPPEEPGPGWRVGGATDAWNHRQECRPLWVRTGALAWARALQLPEPAPPKVRKTPAKRKAAPARTLGIKDLTKPFGEREETRLRKTCSDYPRLHGLLQAVAWSPQMHMPNAWLPAVMALHDRMPNSRTQATADKALNDTLAATMQLYNHINQQVLDHQTTPKPPLDEVLKVVSQSDDAVFAWAAGFVQGCELSLAAWGRAGHKVTGQTGPFGCLRALAARAPAQGGQERVLQDDGKPLLLALEDPPPAQQSLLMALTELWPVVVAARGA